MKKIFFLALLFILIEPCFTSLGQNEGGRESIVKSNSGKNIVITAYDPAATDRGMSRREQARIQKNYATWISNILAQRRRVERTDESGWPEMSKRKLREAYVLYLRFLREIDVETSGFLAFVPGEDARRKIIRKLRRDVLEKIKSLEAGS